MKLFFITCAFCFSSVAISQITITDSDFPSADDTALVSMSDDLTLDLNTTGANSVWDYSSLNITSQRIDTFNGIWGAPVLYQATFNNFITDPDYVADYYTDAQFDLGGAPIPGLDIQSPQVFTKVTNSSVENLGMGLNINGIDVPAKADDIDVQYELPIDYSDSWISSGYLNLDLNPAFNGIFRRYTDRNSIVDGWGEITTPFGTFDVVRVKSYIEYTDSVYVEFGPGGTWFEMPTPSQIEYTWITNGQKIPILTVVTDDDGSGGEIVTKVEFKDMDRGLLSAEEYSFDTNMYPNPAVNELTINTSANTKIEIYSMNGALVYVSDKQMGSTQIDVSEWDRGMYLVKQTQDSNVMTSKVVLN